MAEGWARHFGDDWLQVQSAGIEMHGMNPRAIEVMREAGVDISLQESTRLTDQMLGLADYLVTVCGHADENCPVLPAELRKEHCRSMILQRQRAQTRTSWLCSEKAVMIFDAESRT